jgi:glycosyltransferase involved in cell wall biosynthesis
VPPTGSAGLQPCLHQVRRPRVSILLPARNAASTLQPCLSSIERQTLTEWECVVTDDGSEDQTRAIAEAAAGRDDRFQVIATPHRGLVAALNEGLTHCRAPLVARMDADDLMHSDRLAAQVDALQGATTLSAVGCHVRLFPRARMSARLREYEAWLNGMSSAADVARDAFVECPIAHPTLMMRRDMASLGYVDRGWPEDHDLVLRALAAGLRLGVVPRRLLSWRDDSGRLSRTDPRYGLEAFTACRAHHLAAGFLSSTGAYVLWGYGGTGRALRRALARHGRTPSHIVEIKRSRIGNRIHGAPVIEPAALVEIRGTPIVVSVARAEPRSQIRAALEAMGFVERRDFICAA